MNQPKLLIACAAVPSMCCFACIAMLSKSHTSPTMLLQAQRAGAKGPSASKYPQVWKWKEPAFTNACPTVYKKYGGNSGTFTGTFEAGSALLASLHCHCLCCQDVLMLQHTPSVHSRARPIACGKDAIVLEQRCSSCIMWRRTCSCCPKISVLLVTTVSC